MSYRIQYGPPQRVERQQRFAHRKSSLLLALAAALTILLFVAVNAVDLGAIKEFLIPGDAKVTEAAFSGFVTDMREGAGFVDAFTGFCREIIEHAV